jgi:hypothetical protein
MPRHALRSFFERVIVASLPLVVPACGGGGNTGTTTNPPPADMAVSTDPGDMTATPEVDDLAGPTGDLLNFDLESCEIDHPIKMVNASPNLPLDAGFTLCVTGEPCTSTCGDGYTICCSPQASDGGAWLVACKYFCGPSGRRPAGLEAAAHSDGCAVGQYFASMAHLEAASVHAFRAMAHELVEHGAPAHLVAAARRAARDEIRHARLTRAMARAHGGTPSPVKVTAPEKRSLEEIATENAIEGCVRETYGALLASWQARAAHDPAVREMMVAIAEDEARHADLAWALDAWTRTQLSADARNRVREARAAAVEALAVEVDDAPAAELVSSVGLPDVERARHFFAEAKRELWS